MAARAGGGGGGGRGSPSTTAVSSTSSPSSSSSSAGAGATGSEAVDAAKRRLNALAVARLLSVYLPVVGGSVARRVVYGPRLPSWPLSLEVIVDLVQHGGRYARRR